MPSTLTTKVYDYIRQGMLVDKWPDGLLFSSNTVAREMGISHTPVREALAQLENEGLVEKVDKVGVRVRRLNRQEMEETFDLRLMLECGAVRLAAQRITEDQLAELGRLMKDHVRLFRAMRSARLSKIEGEVCEHACQMDMLFHLNIMKASGNSRVLKIVSDLHILTRLAWTRQMLPGEDLIRRSIQILKFHLCILRSLKKHDGISAYEWMRRHLESAKEYNLNLFDWFHRTPTASVNIDQKNWSEKLVRFISRMEDDLVDENAR